MKINRKKKTFVYIILGLIIIQGSIAGYSVVNKKLFSTQEQQTATASPVVSGPTPTPASIVIDTTAVQGDVSTNNIEISSEIQDIIRQADPDNFDKNLTNYKNLLVRLDVHLTYKTEIERLLKGGYKINDILTAYEFLYDSYGKKEEIEPLAKEKVNGKAWGDIFKEYNTNNPEFVPSNFNSDYLEKLLNTPGITKDDIMIADRVAQKTKISFDSIIEQRFSAVKWKVINASLGVINSQQTLSNVPVTPEQVKKYVSGSFTEQKVIQALVISNKFNALPTDVIDMMRNGLSKENVYAKILEAKYY